MSETTGATSEQIEAALDRWNPNWREHDGTALVTHRRRLTERLAALIVPPGYRIIPADADHLGERTREDLTSVLDWVDQQFTSPQLARLFHSLDRLRALAAGEPFDEP